MAFISERNLRYIGMMKDIYNVSSEFNIKSYIWGGFAIDILNGSISREHGDLDYFTENLTLNINDLRKAFEKLGYITEYLEEFWMLKIIKDDIHAGFNNLGIIDGVAHWYHIGKHGTVLFPYEWLDTNPNDFFGAKIYTAGEKFLYAIKSKVHLLNPEWAARVREKDEADIKILEKLLQSKGISTGDIYSNIWSYNPFWYIRGYKEYLKPIIIE